LSLQAIAERTASRHHASLGAAAAALLLGIALAVGHCRARDRGQLAAVQRWLGDERKLCERLSLKISPTRSQPAVLCLSANKSSAQPQSI